MQLKIYAGICSIKYAQICTNMQNICNNMHQPHKYGSLEKICKICTKYAIICKMCSHEISMQNMQKFALPTLLMGRLSHCQCQPRHSGWPQSRSDHDRHDDDDSDSSASHGRRPTVTAAAAAMSR